MQWSRGYSAPLHTIKNKYTAKLNTRYIEGICNMKHETSIMHEYIYRGEHHVNVSNGEEMFILKCRRRQH